MGFSPNPHAALVHWVSGLSSSAICQGLLQWLSSNSWPVNAGATGNPEAIPESGRSLGRGNGNPLQNSCLENSMDTRAWQATVHKVARSQTERLSREQKEWKYYPQGQFENFLKIFWINNSCLRTSRKMEQTFFFFK